MTARPILFSGPMIQALLAGTKTQTRRIIKRVEGDTLYSRCGAAIIPMPTCDHLRKCHYANLLRMCPYGQPGDLLWVRESFWHPRSYPCILPSGEPDPGSHWSYRGPVHYAADGPPPNVPNRHYPEGLRNGAYSAPDPYATWGKRPSIHMPRWASRLTLELTEVRVESLQAISETDAYAEGIDTEGNAYLAAEHGKLGGANGPAASVCAYADLWDSINGTGSWNSKPWVWALTFRVHRCNVDEMLKRKAS